MVGVVERRRDEFWSYTNLPWQCLYLLPDPHGQVSLRLTLPQLDGSFELRIAARTVPSPAIAGTREAPDIAISSLPELRSILWASMSGNGGSSSQSRCQTWIKGSAAERAIVASGESVTA